MHEKLRIRIIYAKIPVKYFIKIITVDYQNND